MAEYWADQKVACLVEHSAVRLAVWTVGWKDVHWAVLTAAYLVACLVVCLVAQ